MSRAFQICFIKPPEYEGSLVFREILFLLRNSLRDLGHTVEIVPNQLHPVKTNILIGYHLLQWGEYLAKVDYIPFQFEQLDTKEGWFSDTILAILKGASQVWDYSSINIEFLRQQGVTAQHVPIGYHPDLAVVPKAEEKDIDVLFYGSVNDRRKELMERLARKCNAQFIAGAFAQERDELIARSKIVLNLHYYQTKIMESVRIAHLLNNGVFVISEDSADDAFPGVDLITAPYDEIEELCLEYLAAPERIAAQAALTARQFKDNMPMTEILERVVI